MTLAIGMLLDAALGEPKWLWSRMPHPAVLMGRLIGWADDTFNAGARRQLKGAMVMAGLVAVAAALGLIVTALPWQIAEVILLAVLLAQRSLSDHLRDVSEGLRNSLVGGRVAVARIVGRDTAELDEAAIARAAIESGAENLSDGVIAPIFWFVIGGAPGLLIYKITNTADSMIGYLTPRHHRFGWAAAKLDDLLNWVPARLTAAMILTVTWRWDMAERVIEEAPEHRSPNAGWPEAAAAHALNLALSGPRSYDGEMRDFPYVNAGGVRELGPQHIDEMTQLLWKTWGLALIPALLVLLF